MSQKAARKMALIICLLPASTPTFPSHLLGHQSSFAVLRTPSRPPDSVWCSSSSPSHTYTDISLGGLFSCCGGNPFCASTVSPLYRFTFRLFSCWLIFGRMPL